MNLILLTESDRLDHHSWCLHGPRAVHIRTVLRATEGDIIQIGLLNGPAGTARVARITDDHVLLDSPSLAPLPEPSPTIDLVCALPRPQTLKKILFTSAMMGVRRLCLIRANRVEKSYFNSPLLKPENYSPFLHEGLSQGKLTRLPEITLHDRFKPFFEDTLTALDRIEPTAPLRLLPDLDTPVMLDTLLNRARPIRLVIAIGPEGGWVPFEIDLMTAIGFQPFSLGRYILRVEHAVTAVLSQVELLRPR